MKEFRAAEREASQNRRGLWGPRTQSASQKRPCRRWFPRSVIVERQARDDPTPRRSKGPVLVEAGVRIAIIEDCGYGIQRPDTQLRIRALSAGIFAYLAVFRVVAFISKALLTPTSSEVARSSATCLSPPPIRSKTAASAWTQAGSGRRPGVRRATGRGRCTCAKDDR